jgi:acyl carrier protein
MVLGDPGMPSHDELANWLTARVARTLNVSPDTIDSDTPLADYGIDSAASLALCADLEAEKGIAVETTIVWDHATIGAIAAYLVTEELSS